MEEDQNVNSEMNVNSVTANAAVKAHQDGSGWFFWIAGLSLINSVVLLSGSEWSFLIGLGITQVVDALALGAVEVETLSRTTVLAIAFIIDVVIASSFIMWGVLSRKFHQWAYLVGMLLYILDGLIFLLVGDYPSFGFHLFALFFIFNGFRACGQLKRMATAAAAIPNSQDLVS